MQNDTREARAEGIQVLLPWGMPAQDRGEDFFENTAVWLGGGVLLLAWTGLALLLTA